MKINVRPVLISLLLVAGLFTGSGYLGAQMVKNTLCPVMRGHAVREKFFTDYEGKRIYFCCHSCVKSFQKHPERYFKNLEASFD